MPPGSAVVSINDDLTAVFITLKFIETYFSPGTSDFYSLSFFIFSFFVSQPEAENPEVCVNKCCVSSSCLVKTNFAKTLL